jgi:hypothetical protein
MSEQNHENGLNGIVDMARQAILSIRRHYGYSCGNEINELQRLIEDHDKSKFMDDFKDLFQEDFQKLSTH